MNGLGICVVLCVMATSCGKDETASEAVSTEATSTTAEATAHIEKEQPQTTTVDGSSELIAIPNGVIYHGHLTGGQPTDANYEDLAKAGYTSVIDLRMPNEEGADDNEAKVKELGMSYLRIAIGGPTDFTKENVQRFATALASGRTVVHCKSGNRVGAMFALKEAWIDGLPIETAIADGKKAGLTKLEAAVKELLGTSE